VVVQFQRSVEPSVSDIEYLQLFFSSNPVELLDFDKRV